MLQTNILFYLCKTMPHVTKQLRSSNSLPKIIFPSWNGHLNLPILILSKICGSLLKQPSTSDSFECSTIPQRVLKHGTAMEKYYSKCGTNWDRTSLMLSSNQCQGEFRL